MKSWVPALIAIALMAAATLSAATTSAATTDGRATAAPGQVTSGITAYRQGQAAAERSERLRHFATAERLFSAAAGQRANAALYVNQGTAALQAEHLGAAVLAYRRALQLDPDHPTARRNLEHARDLLPKWVARPESGGVWDSFFFWHGTWSVPERSGAAALLFLLAATLLAVHIGVGTAWLRAVAILPALGWLVLCGSVAADLLTEQSAAAVVVADEAVARVSDSANAAQRFSAALPGGTEVRIAEMRQGWARVVLADGREAWMAASALEAVHARPPDQPAAD